MVISILLLLMLGEFHIRSSTLSSSANPFVSGGGNWSGGTTLYIPSTWPTSSMSIPMNTFLMVSHPSTLSVPFGGNVSFGLGPPSSGVSSFGVSSLGGGMSLLLCLGAMCPQSFLYFFKLSRGTCYANPYPTLYVPIWRRILSY